MINIFSAVKAICIYSDWTISNLSIQRLLYISQMIHLGRNSPSAQNLTPLVKHHFYAWAYGPVVPEVYRKLKMFGADNVTNFSTLAAEDDPDTSQKEYQTIQYVCEELKGCRSSQLIAYTHDPKGAWSHLYDSDIPDTVIPREEIYNEYQRRYLPKAS